jgi:hypothetical protein
MEGAQRVLEEDSGGPERRPVVRFDAGVAQIADGFVPDRRFAIVDGYRGAMRRQIGPI